MNNTGIAPMSAMKTPLFAGYRERAETLIPLRIIIYRHSTPAERHDRSLLYVLSIRAKGRAIALHCDYGERTGRHGVKKMHFIAHFFLILPYLTYIYHKLLIIFTYGWKSNYICVLYREAIKITSA